MTLVHITGKGGRVDNSQTPGSLSSASLCEPPRKAHIGFQFGGGGRLASGAKENFLRC